MSAYSRMRRRGGSMIETVLVIAVGLGLMAGGVAFYANTNAAAQTQNLILTAVPAISGIRKVADANAGNFFVVTQKNLVDQGYIPEDLDRGDHFVTPDGVKLRITTPSPFEHADLHILDVGMSLCMKIVNPSSPLVSDEMRPFEIKVNGATAGRFGGAGKLCDIGMPNDIVLSYR